MNSRARRTLSRGDGGVPTIFVTGGAGYVGSHFCFNAAGADPEGIGERHQPEITYPASG